MRRRLGLAAATLLALPILLAGPSPTAAASVTFETPRVSSTFGVSIVFDQPVRLARAPKRAEVLLYFPGSLGAEANEVPISNGLTQALRYQLDLSQTSLKPNTRIEARWRLTFGDGTAETGPQVSVLYADTRFDWKTRSGAIVRVHWYQGTAAFGERALAIGEKAVDDASKLLGVAVQEPVDFFVYADQKPFYDALGPGTRENVGGQAVASIRTLFALITPREINAGWVGIVIPHELTHLVFNTAVDNPYHFPPRWLNEGLAVYLSQGYDAGDRSQVEGAARDGSIIPLDGLTGEFPATGDRFSLAYAESVSAVDFMVRKYSKAALVSLIRSYATGVTDDEAFRAALGVDTGAFDDAWLAQLGTKAPPKVGPVSAPAGPLPTGWSGPANAGNPPAPGSTAQSAPRVTAAPNAPSNSPTSATDRSLGVVLGLILVLIAVAAIAWLLRRSVSARPSGPAS